MRRLRHRTRGFAVCRPLVFVVVLLGSMVCSLQCASSPAQSPANEQADSKTAADVRQEISVGRALAARLAKRYRIWQDVPATRYLNLLGQYIAQNSSRSELDFHFGILDDDSINAYACPGGYILITRGALASMQDESELAGVLAHEISHVALRHSGQFQDQSHWIDVLATFLSGGFTVINSSIRTASESLETELLSRGRSRAMEFESDQAGALLASSLGYDPHGQVRYLSRLARNNRAAQGLEDTHPPTAERIQQLQLFIRDNQLSGGRRNQSRFQGAMQNVALTQNNATQLQAQN
ncbi:MAG: M48 family metalloprotease [Leptospiraceae bacterium]|nr:M48 family metalloprotease [Leptospiraceae bacterium]